MGKKRCKEVQSSLNTGVSAGLKKKSNTQDLIAERNQARNDMQQNAVTKCVAMVKKMIVQALDYSAHFQKQPDCTHSSGSDTHTQPHIWLS